MMSAMAQNGLWDSRGPMGYGGRLFRKRGPMQIIPMPCKGTI